MQTPRLIVQWGFFAFFLALMLTNNAQFWMAFIFLSILLAAIFGRYYCGWICPIYTLIRPTRRLSQKLGWTRESVPEILKTEKPRWIVFILFLGALGYTMYTITQGQKFPLPVFIIGLGVLTTLVMNEDSWHRYLCPWGTLLHLTGRFSRKCFHVNEQCIRCGKCVEVCPAEAVMLNKPHRASIMPKHCLLCAQCRDVCPVSAIHYTHEKK